MNYKYQKGQIFGKKLKVPKYILLRVYNCNLFLNEFFEYELDDKIPITCLNEADRRIVEKFGIEKVKKLDWELLNKPQLPYIYIDFNELLMSIDTSVEDLNTSLYELVKDQIRPSDYSSRMKEVYKDRLLEISSDDYSDLKYEKEKFNDGKASLEDLIRNWELYKNKDLSYCLQNDSQNDFNITNNQLKDFMNKYETISRLIINNTNINIYQFINRINAQKNESEKQEYIKQITDNILEKSINLEGYQRVRVIELSNNEYKELFKYSSMSDYLRKLNYDYANRIIEDLSNLPNDYIFNMPISVSNFFDSKEILHIAGICGLKNIIDFDNECNQFLTKNDCEMLKKINEHVGNFSNTKTKDEFYKLIREIITEYPLDYRSMTGEFPNRNPELFISKQAPKELQDLFYAKNITPHLLVEHPDYIPYLNGKDLGACFKLREVKINGSNAPSGYEKFYNFISGKANFNDVINFIIEYRDILEIVFEKNVDIIFKYEINFFEEDNIDLIKRKIDNAFRILIIEEGIQYPQNIPQSILTNYPSMFLSADSPKELQEAFYNRKINTEYILSHRPYIEFLKYVELEVLFKYIPVNVVQGGYVNLISAIKKTFEMFGFESLDMMLSYGKYIEAVYEANKFQNFKFDLNFSREDLLNELDNTILQTINDGKMKYDENIPIHFKNNNPTLFLSQNVPQDIRNKFYNRELTLNDFNTNPKLIDMFENTNIVYGFSEKISWMLPLFKNLDNMKIANYNRLKVITEYFKIQDVALQDFFKEYILQYDYNIEPEKIEYIAEVLTRLSTSNSNEIFRFRIELANQILKSDNPNESLNKIEDIFIKNNIPTVGKIYTCFETLHPNFKGFNFDDSKISPVLKNSSTMAKKIIVFSDLIKSAFGSNNQSVNSYLKNIEIGTKLYENLKSGQIQYESLSEVQKKELNIFSKHLETLYNNTLKGKRETESFTATQDVLTNIMELSKKLSPNGTLDYNLGDRVIRMFCGFAGIDTLEQAKNYISQKVKNADERNRKASNFPMTLEKGDFIKGIGDITYLRNILQNGSVSKEYLGSSADSDRTPLDTDVSMIIESDGTIEDKIYKTAANGYGPIWFVLKNDDRFLTTRTSSETLNIKNDMSKMEIFYTGYLGLDHYGIRTGFASSEINYIVMDSYDSRVGLEIALNGFYIPIANKEGQIIFTPKDYDDLRAKMSGLSYYGENNYAFSENLVTEEIATLASQIEQSNYETQVKRAKINEIIKTSLEKLGLHLKTNIDGDLTEGFVELIDTGSTGRGTNTPGAGDFDFMMRLDKKLLSNPTKIKELKQILLKNLGKENSSELTGDGDFRLKNVQIANDINVDIDITFTEKTDNISYSTDMALQDKLTTIQKSNPEKYKYVVANILFAKKVLKEAEAYKPNRGETPQGGLGGIGVENWILQNGGSFIDAATSFINAAEGKDFEKFKESYKIWDFGDNHLAEKRGNYSHDNFIANNMSEDGYYKMVEVLKEYLKNYTYNQNDEISEIDSINR